MTDMVDDSVIAAAPMFDRVAWAIGQKIIRMTPDEGTMHVFTGADVRRLARAAIDAMREPDEAMLSAQVSAHVPDYRHAVWQAMIDAALSQSGEDSLPPRDAV